MTKKLLIIFIIIGTRSFAQECPPDTLQIESIQDSWSLPYLNDWDNVEIIDEFNNWLYVQLEDGYKGWLNRFYISNVEAIYNDYIYINADYRS